MPEESQMFSYNSVGLYICFIWRLSSYCAVNTLQFSYKKQSVNVV